MDKCIIDGCNNTKDQGNFVGDICSPCYELLTSGDLDKHKQGTSFIHKIKKCNCKPKEKYVDIEVDFTDEEFLKIAKAAHNLDITFNEFCRKAMKKIYK